MNEVRTYPTVVVEINEGIVTSIIGDQLINVIVIDRDTEGATDGLTVIDDDNAFVRDEMCEVDLDYVDGVTEAMP